MTRQTHSFPPSVGAYHVVTAADRGPAPGLVTEMKSEAAVGPDQRSAPHSSAGALMASDNTGGDGQARSLQFGLTSLFERSITQFSKINLLS